ncbi:hypothetical protein HHA02_04950 [Cobetia marina]|nr:hypothetical protein HHA02_04950 [Cobetia marina]
MTRLMTALMTGRPAIAGLPVICANHSGWLLLGTASIMAVVLVIALVVVLIVALVVVPRFSLT